MFESVVAALNIMAHEAQESRLLSCMVGNAYQSHVRALYERADIQQQLPDRFVSYFSNRITADMYEKDPYAIGGHLAGKEPPPLLWKLLKDPQPWEDPASDSYDPLRCLWIQNGWGDPGEVKSTYEDRFV